MSRRLIGRRSSHQAPFVRAHRDADARLTEDAVRAVGHWNAWIDEFRLSVDVVRWTAA